MKSQVSMEFLLTMGMMMLVFISLVLLTNSGQVEIDEYRGEMELKNPCDYLVGLITNVYVMGDGAKLQDRIEYDFTIFGQNNLILISDTEGFINKTFYCKYSPLNVTNGYTTAFKIPMYNDFTVENVDGEIEIKDSAQDIGITGLWKMDEIREEELMGDDVVEDGGFNNPDSWNVVGGWTVTVGGGEALFKNGNLAATLSQSIDGGLTDSGTYALEIVVDGFVGTGALEFYLGDVLVDSISGLGTYLYEVEVDNDDHLLIIGNPTTANFEAKVQSVTIQEITDANVLVDDEGIIIGVVNGAIESDDVDRGDVLGFDGDDFIEIQDKDGEFFSDTFTVSAWISLASSPLINHIAAKSDVFDFAVELDSSDKLALRVYDTTVPYETETIESLSLNTWFFMVGVFDGVNINLYIDGELKTSEAYTGGTINSNDNSIIIGENFDGYIDDLRIYNRPLTEYEISRLYNSYYNYIAEHLDELPR